MCAQGQVRSENRNDGGGSSVLEIIALDTHEYDRIYDLEPQSDDDDKSLVN